MSYRNPQRNIDNKYAVMAQGINQYYTNLQNVLTKAAKGKEEYKKKRIKAEKAFQKDIDKKLSPFDKQVKGEIKKIRKALGEDNTNKGLYEDLVGELEYIRKALAYQLRDQDLTTFEIQLLQDSAGNNVNQLTQSLVNLSTAEGQYSDATSKKPNEEGYLLSGGPNQELAQIIKNVDSGKGSATLFNNNKKKELGEYNFNGNYSLVDYASGSIENGQPKEGAIPEGVFDLSSQELTQAVNSGESLFNTVKVIEPGIQEAFNTSVAEMIKADPTLVGANGKIDQIKLKEKLSTPEGREHIESITKIDGNDVTRNYWRSIAPDSVTDFENWDSYANEDIFTNYLIEQAAGSEPVKGTVLEFEERQKVESPQMSKVEDVVEAGKETIAAPTNLEQGNIPSIVKPKNDPLGLFKNTPEKTVVEEVVETPDKVIAEEEIVEQEPTNTRDITSENKKQEDLMRNSEVEYGGKSGDDTVGLSSYKNYDFQTYLNSEDQVVREVDGKGATYGKSGQPKKGLKTDLGKDVYNGLPDGQQAMMRMMHVNIPWDPRVVMLMATGDIKGKDNRSKYLGDYEATTELYNENKAKFKNIDDQKMFDQWVDIYSNTNPNDKGFQKQYKRRVEDMAKAYGYKLSDDQLNKFKVK